MKLQISFDMQDLEKALSLAEKVAPFADILEVGTPLVHKEGVNAITKFKNKFPDKKIFADVKLVDRVEKTIKMFATAGADYISILAGTSNKAIQNASQAAHGAKSLIALDLVDAYSMGQSAMDAKALDIDLIVFHQPHDEGQLIDILDEWETVEGNTKLPIFVAGGINKTNIEAILQLKPKGIIIGSAIVKAEDPAKEAEFFKNLINP